MKVSENILVIDDEVQIRRLLEITLSSNGYKVAEASTSKDGLIAAATHNPALIILDLGLPDSDGIEVLKKLREWYNKPIIILSVKSSEDDIIQALDYGANDYLTKPFRTGELLARIRVAIRQSNGNEDSPVLSFGLLSVDLVNHIAKKNN
jgi:two-component system, OmpR family, KDP operon response regulator KdpE